MAINTTKGNSFGYFDYLKNKGYNPNTPFDLGMNMGTLNLGLAGLNAWQGYEGVQQAKASNQIAREELAFNKDSWNQNFGMQLATINDERARVNAHTGPGKFLNSSQYIAPYDESKYGELRNLAVT